MAVGVHGPDDNVIEQEINLEQLGRRRPAEFSNLIAEVLFCFSLLASMMMSVSRSVDVCFLEQDITLLDVKHLADAD